MAKLLVRAMNMYVHTWTCTCFAHNDSFHQEPMNLLVQAGLVENFIESVEYDKLRKSFKRLDTDMDG